MPYEQLKQVIEGHDGGIIACARNLSHHRDLLERYFTIIEVEEPSDETIKQIIQARSLTAEDSVIDETLELCHFYQPNLCMPGALFNLFDLVRAHHGKVKIDKIKDHLSRKLKAPIRSPIERIAYYSTAGALLKRQVFGQDHVIDEVAMVLENFGKGFTPEEVLRCFHFAGPTGVGKPALAEAIAEFYFESKDRYLFVPMAQYKDAHSLTGLLGSPPLLSVMNKGGLLLKKQKRGPLSLFSIKSIKHISTSL